MDPIATVERLKAHFTHEEIKRMWGNCFLCGKCKSVHGKRSKLGKEHRSYQLPKTRKNIEECNVISTETIKLPLS